MHDTSYKTVIFWLICLALLVFSAVLMYEANQPIPNHLKPPQKPYKVTKQKKAARKELSSFGVVNLKKGIYHIPIDTVINEMAVDSN